MSKLSKERLAEILNWRQYRDEMSKEQEEVAKASDLVVIFWYSDDWVEFRWAINDEIWAWNWTQFFIRGKKIIEKGILEDTLREVENDFEWYFKELVNKDLENSKIINVEYDTDWYAWKINTELPHSTFDIMEDDEKFCRGIILDLNELA